MTATIELLPPDRETLMMPWRMYHAIVGDALSAKFDDYKPGQEMCGIITDEGGGKHRYFRARNVAENPTNSFIVDPYDQRRIVAQAGRTVAGIVHSHPAGEPRPSDMDRESYVPEGWLYGVVGMGGTMPAHLVMYRFDRMTFKIVDLVLTK